MSQTARLGLPQSNRDVAVFTTVRLAHTATSLTPMGSVLSKQETAGALQHSIHTIQTAETGRSCQSKGSLRCP